MRKYAWLILSMGLFIGLVGCGEDDNGGGGGTAGSGGTGGGAVAAVSGIVTAATIEGDEPPVEGATVRVLGTSNSATTDAAGAFTVMAPVGTVLFQTTADGHWGEQLAQNVPAGGVNDLDPQVLPDALVEEIATELSTTAETSMGIVAVAFVEETVVGGETASISVGSELSFVFDADSPVESDTLIAGGGSEVIFVNVDLASGVTASATGADAQPCSPEFPSASYSVQPKVVTVIDVICPE